MSKYLVFAVDGADRLTLLCPPTPEHPHELKQIALSFIQAPKLAKRQATGELGQDEPCAFEAMEAIRSACLGKPVTFEEDFVIEPLQRTSGRMTLPSGQDACEFLLGQGYARTPDRIQPRMSKAIHDRYFKLMTEAKAAKRGVFAPNAGDKIRSLSILSTADTDALLAKLQAVEGDVKVRIERALSASTLVITLPAPFNVQATLALAGVVAPLAKDGEVQAEAASEGKFHVERFLLHRTVSVRFTGVDHFFNLVGSVVSPKGSFQAELIAKGFVTINGATLHLAEPFVASLREAESEAQKQKVGIWKNYSEGRLEVTTGAPAGTSSSLVPAGGAGATANQEVAIEGDREFPALVLQVLTSDTLILKNLNSGALVKASLAGVRVSKNVSRDHDGKTPETRVTYKDFAWEAKELLRTQFVGKRVSVIVDYARIIPETKEVRPMITCIEDVSRTNLGAALLDSGYATFFLGRNDYCAHAELLQSSELGARHRGLGLHSSKTAPETKVVELSRLGESKGKYYLAFLQRGMVQGRPPVLRGIVDAVVGGGSLRVYIPKEHFQIPFKIAGVTAPQGAVSPGDVADPLAAEAKEFTMTHLMQREVDIQVDTVDRAGNFIGNVSLVGAAKTFAVTLVEAGLAVVSNADRLTYIHQLRDAEAAAKSKALGIWSQAGAVPQRFARQEAAFAAASPDHISVASDASWTPVTLVDVADANTVYVQVNTVEAREARSAIQEALQVAAAGSAYTPKKKGELVCAYYREDKTWNRAKVLATFADEGVAEVQFIDFGTKQEVRLKDLRPVPKEDTVLLSTPPQALTVKLACIKSRGPNADYADTAYDEIYEYAGESCELVAKCVYATAADKFYILSTSDKAKSLNEHVLEAGVAVLDKHTKASVPAVFERMRVAQEVARKAHKRLWKFGDADEDSDDE
jgi:staphylococcal nuclease domain-containing protein 1